MKIAIVLPNKIQFSAKSLSPLGLCIKDLLNFSKYKKETTVYGTTTEKKDSYIGINYKKLNLKKSFLKSNTDAHNKALLEKFKEDKPSIIEIHNRPITARYLKKHLPNTKVCLHLHNSPLDMRYNKLRRLYSVRLRKKLINKSDNIYCVSKFIKETMEKGLGYEYDKIKILYNALDINEFNQEKYQKQKKENIFLFAGRMVPEKGILEFANAFLAIHKKLPKWKAVFIAPASLDDKFKTNFINTINKLPKDQIKYIDFLPHDKVMEYYAKSKIAVLPSYWNEPFGRTILEAALLKCAIITGKNGGIPEIIKTAGIYVKNYDIQDLAKKMLETAKNEKTIKEKSKLAYENAQDFDIKKMSLQLDKFRDELCS